MITNLYIDFDFIKSKNCKTLRIMDLSNWSIYENDAAYVKITTPGSLEPIVHIFQKGKYNIFNSNNLNLSDVHDYSDLANLPDGVYTVSVVRCEDDPKGVTKYFLQDCQIRCQVARKLLAVDLNCNSCKRELLVLIQDVILFLDAAQAQVDQCNPNKAMEYYRKAVQLLNRL